MTEDNTSAPPSPGSDEAGTLGCLCPIYDNHHGRGCGFTDDDGKPLFVIREDCPIHGDDPESP